MTKKSDDLKGLLLVKAMASSATSSQTQVDLINMQSQSDGEKLIFVCQKNLCNCDQLRLNLQLRLLNN